MFSRTPSRRPLLYRTSMIRVGFEPCSQCIVRAKIFLASHCISIKIVQDSVSSWIRIYTIYRNFLLSQLHLSLITLHYGRRTVHWTLPSRSRRSSVSRLLLWVSVSVANLRVQGLFIFQCEIVEKKKKKTPCSESASELYRMSDRRLSAKWLPTFSDRGVPHGQCDGSLRPYSRFSRQEPLLFYQVAHQLYSRGWVHPVTDPLLFF
jgi:hypothetical protein